VLSGLKPSGRNRAFAQNSFGFQKPLPIRIAHIGFQAVKRISVDELIGRLQFPYAVLAVPITGVATRSIG